MFCCGGAARETLEAGAKHGETSDVLSVPALGQSVRDNRVNFFKTVRRNLGPILFKPEIVRGLARRLEALEPAVLVTDFEPFSALAAELIGLPTVSLNRQQILTETRPRVPRAHSLNAALTAGRGAAHRAATTRARYPALFCPPLTAPPPRAGQPGAAHHPRRGANADAEYGRARRRLHQPRGGGGGAEGAARFRPAFCAFRFRPGGWAERTRRQFDV